MPLHATERDRNQEYGRTVNCMRLRVWCVRVEHVSPARVSLACSD
jgi:hypothetical protein